MVTETAQGPPVEPGTDARSRRGDADAAFECVLRDSILHVLFSPRYFFHRAAAERDIVRPVFGLERLLLEMSGRTASAIASLERAADLLSRFGRSVAVQYLTSVFELGAPDRSEPTPVDSLLEAYVRDEVFDLLDPDEQRRFCRLGPISIGGSYGVRSDPARTVLVLGTYYPLTHDYVTGLFAAPTSPDEKLAAGCELSEIEKTLHVCNSLLARGYESVTPKAYRRDMANVFRRTVHLMRTADRIVLLLAGRGCGVTMEYGIVCADQSLASKTDVFVREDAFITGMATHGTFLLDVPRTIVYRDAQELIARVEELFPTAGIA